MEQLILLAQEHSLAILAGGHFLTVEIQEKAIGI
mgnify:FL=1